MTDKFNRAKDLFKWNERAFSIIGMWPLSSTYLRFSVVLFYYLLHITMQSIDLYGVFGDLELMIENLSESSLQVLILIKLVLIRSSRKMPTLIRRVLDDIDEKHFHNSDEIRIYLSYNRIAKKFFKVWYTMGILSAVGYYVKPGQLYIEAVMKNETVSYKLAYRAQFFIEVDTTAKFLFAWIYQSPVMYFGIWHTAAIGFLFSLVLHACGRLAILSFRIKNLNIDRHPDDERSSAFIFKNIIATHRQIFELTEGINDVFSLVLLEELIITTVLVGLTIYSALVKMETADAEKFFSFMVYGGTLLFLIYGYCAAGEYLATESLILYKSYYENSWYDMPTSVQKQLIICMIGASKPMQLTAGHFYIFSLSNFMGIVKTAAGYISMLRTLV